MVQYEQRAARLVLREPLVREAPRLVLRQPKHEITASAMAENGPNQNRQAEMFHEQGRHAPLGDLPYTAVFPLSPYHCPPGAYHSALQIPPPGNPQEFQHAAIYNGVDTRHFGTPSHFAPIHDMYGPGHLEAHHHRMALRPLRQEHMRPLMQLENFANQGYYQQSPSFPQALNVRTDARNNRSTGSDVTTCPPIDRGLEDRIRASLARSGLLKDCPEPEYVNRPAALDPAVVSCGPVTNQPDESHHHTSRSYSNQTDPSEAGAHEARKQALRTSVIVNGTHMNARKKDGKVSYKGAGPKPRPNQIQNYRGVDSQVQVFRRRDNHPPPYNVETKPRFLTKDDYTPAKRIIGYYLDPPAQVTKPAKRTTVSASEYQEKQTSKPANERDKAFSESDALKYEVGHAQPKATKFKVVNTKENAPKVHNERPSPAMMIKVIDVGSNSHSAETNEESDPSCHRRMAEDQCSEDSERSAVTVVRGSKNDNTLEDCIRTLASWKKGDRQKLKKLLEVLKSIDLQDDAIIDSAIKTSDHLRSPRKERKSSSILNPNAVPFTDFSSMRDHITETRKKFYQKSEGQSLHQVFPDLPTSFQQPGIPMDPVWIKTEPNKFIRPPPGIQVTLRPPPDKVPSEEDEGRMAARMDPRMAEPLLTRFMEKYPLTGTTAPLPLPPLPKEVKTASQIQLELEILLLQEKERKVLKKT